MPGDLASTKNRAFSIRFSGTGRLRRNRRRPSGKIRMFLLGVVALLAAAPLIVVLVHVLDTRGSRDLAAAEAEARAAGLPIDYSDPLFQRYENAASLDPNAATVYAEAFDLVSKLRPEKRDPNLPVEGKADLPDDPRTPLPPEMLSAVREHVSERQHALDLIHAASGVTPCLFPVHWKGPDTDLPHLARARAAARLIRLSVILHAEDGDPHAAVSSVLDGLALAKPLVEEPVLISSLVAIALDSITLASAQRLLARTDPTAEDLVTLQKQFEASAEALSIRAGLSGEIANMSEAFKLLEQGRVPGSAAVTLPDGTEESAGNMKLGAFSAWFFRNDLKGSNAEMIRMLVKLVSAAEKPTPDVLGEPYGKALDSQLAASRYRFAFLARMLLPAELRSIQQCEIARAKLRSAVACVAALRFRNDTGAWPASLAALLPKYLTAVPLDPFTAKPLIYRVRDDGIVVYTVGKNGIDDGGKPWLIAPDKSDVGDYDDWGFRIWK